MGALAAGLLAALSLPGGTRAWLLGAALVAGGAGLWLMLPKGSLRGRTPGALLAAVGLGLLACLLPPLGAVGPQLVFWLLAGTAVIGGAATISMRSPVYSAVWFALTLLAVSGLFVYQGALFLGVATVVVYAGAILVTFLFVLMLARPEGHAFYDRLSWGQGSTVFAVAAAVLLVGGLTHAFTHAAAVPAAEEEAEPGLLAGVMSVPAQAALPPPAAGSRAEGVLAAEHTPRLGGFLLTRHLVAIEAAGALLLAALVGAVAIAIQGKDPELVHGAGREEARHG